MKIQLSDHFTYKKLLRFVLPSVVMMIFTSIYGVIDGLFVSNFVGKTPFAALNLIMPFLMMMAALGFMIGTGGSAIVAITLGEGDKERANRYFSMLVYVTLAAGLVLTVLGVAALRPIAAAMGAEGEMLENCVLYGRIILFALAPFMLQNVFQSFFVTAEKPKLGLAMTVAAGLTNIVLDYVFIVPLGWGLAGAALATALSQVVGGVAPLLYFARKNDSLLRLTRASFEGRILIKACTNGSSELMTNISMSLVNILYNFQLMSVAGEDGVAAYGVIMYVNFIFAAMFLGYAIGSAPVISYHYGAANHAELKNLFRKSLTIVALAAFTLTIVAEALAAPLATVFVGYDAGLMELTRHGFRLYALSFLMNGFNIFGSAFFTALGDGLVSALISFLRTLLFQVAAVLLLPLVFGVDGIWLAIVAAELLALLVTVWFLARKRTKYHYA
ncbi:MATE family efflux transporter [Agathobaculum sp. NTUH-O15-33]|uniref:MATE family efflux transporter n=1 Tax=Agathobaculum sp. NTUH-O15-33 TaxID=3079302 RepID=UPI002958439B|nr:MATE family efflux transporter [Agathobaculum sp. NTUH-O15-33]WNX85957.1 MATE family efflux transporter [Agathobaculum sp. NTUH-O15-33]